MRLRPRLLLRRKLRPSRLRRRNALRPQLGLAPGSRFRHAPRLFLGLAPRLLFALETRALGGLLKRPGVTGEAGEAFGFAFGFDAFGAGDVTLGGSLRPWRAAATAEGSSGIAETSVLIA